MISYSFIKNHGFNDVNKSVGCIILLTLCHKNNIQIKPSQKYLNYYFRKYKLLLVFRYIGKSFLGLEGRNV